MNRPNNIPFEEYKTSPCLEDRRIIQYIELLENKVKNLGVLADVSNCSACGIEIEHKGKCEVCHCKGLEAYEA